MAVLPGVIARFSITVTVAGLLAIFTIATALLYIFIPDAREELEFCAAIIGGAAVVYSGFYAGLSLRTSMDLSRKNTSFSILNALNQEDLTTIRILIEKELLVKRDEMSRQEVYDKVVNDANILKAATAILGLYEDSSIAVQEGFADERVLYTALCFQVPWIFNGLKPYIEQEKGLTHTDLYCETKKLVDKWENKKLLSTGKDAPKLNQVE